LGRSQCMRRHGEPRRDRRDRYKNRQNALHFDRPTAGRGAIESKPMTRPSTLRHRSRLHSPIIQEKKVCDSDPVLPRGKRGQRESP
jgi:hypothetical protein